MDSQLSRAEIDLTAISHNVNELRRVTEPTARLMAVVKADAYGHGMIEVAARALKCGAEFLGVARIDEAIRLREAGMEVPVLIFGYTPPSRSGELIEYGLTQTVSSHQAAVALSRAAAS